MGRPPKAIDQKTFENLCGIQCTMDEICAVFDVSKITLERWCKRTYGETFSTVFAQKRQAGKIALRRAQFRQVEKGNTGMIIFLSKNLLGMSDTVKVESQADGKLADLIDGLMEPLNDLHEEATGADAPLAGTQTEAP